jgi:hypothetical protein
MEFKPLSETEKNKVLEMMPFLSSYHRYLNVDLIIKDVENVLKEICTNKEAVEFLKTRKHYSNYYVDINESDYEEEFEEYTEKEKKECTFLSYFPKLRRIVTLDLHIDKDLSCFMDGTEEDLFRFVKKYILNLSVSNEN